MTTTVFYNDKYVSAKYAFDTTRKSQHIYQSLIDDPIDGVVVRDPSDFEKATKHRIRTAHGAKYVNAVKTGTPRFVAESNGFDWDPNIYHMAVAQNSGIVAAVDTVSRTGGLAGSLSSGLHHASTNHGSGFCTFNGLVVGSLEAVANGRRALVVDFDAHGGGGTNEMLTALDLHRGVTHVDVTVSPFDVWEPAGMDMFTKTTPKTYLDDIERTLDYATGINHLYDLVIYNAGMDPLNSGVSEEQIITREKMVRSFIDSSAKSAVFALAGGYTWGDNTMGDVVRWHRYTLEAWA